MLGSCSRTPEHDSQDSLWTLPIMILCSQVSIDSSIKSMSPVNTSPGDCFRTQLPPLACEHPPAWPLPASGAAPYTTLPCCPSLRKPAPLAVFVGNTAALLLPCPCHFLTVASSLLRRSENVVYSLTTVQSK